MAAAGSWRQFEAVTWEAAVCALDEGMFSDHPHWSCVPSVLQCSVCEHVKLRTSPEDRFWTESQSEGGGLQQPGQWRTVNCRCWREPSSPRWKHSYATPSLNEWRNTALASERKTSPCPDDSLLFLQRTFFQVHSHGEPAHRAVWVGACASWLVQHVELRFGDQSNRILIWKRDRMLCYGEKPKK